jgi:outer membrane protein TolC
MLSRTAGARLAMVAVVACVVSAGLSVPRDVLAQTSTTATSLPSRIGVFGERELSLADALAAVLDNNVDIAVSRTGTEQATYAVAGARGAFDARLSFQSSFVRQVVPVSSIIGGGASGRLTQQDLLVGPRLEGFLPSLGTNYQLSFTSRRQATDNTFTTLNPQFPTALVLSITQPLLRGRRIDSARRQIEITRKNEELSEAQFQQLVMDVTLQTEQAYWDLVFARQNLQIQRDGLALASQQVDSNIRLVDQGVGAPIDVVEARTQLALARQNAYAAQTLLTRTENALKLLMAGDRSSPFWPVALLPSTARREAGTDPSLEDAVGRALARRPELTQTAIVKATNEANTRFFRDQTRPQVDLVGTYTGSGLAGRTIDLGPNPLTAGFQPLVDRLNSLSGLQGLPPLDTLGGSESSTPSLLVGGVGQSLSNLARQDFPTMEVGLRLSLPFRNRTAQANLAGSLIEGRRIQLQRRQIEGAIEADVRNALQAVSSARASLEAASEGSRLAGEQYASEQRKFEAGTSTVFLVLQRQNALIATRSQQARAEADLNKSLAVLSRATGEILRAHRITATSR